MFRKWWFRFNDYFGFSPKEARGAATLLVISGLLLTIPVLYRRIILPQMADEVFPDEKLLDSLANLLKKPPRASTWIAEADSEKTVKPRRIIRRRPFDPNAVSFETLLSLGIPDFLASRIVNYRTKGGRFREKRDLLRIYDFPDTLYRTLAPYIKLEKGRSEAKPVADLAKPENFGKPRAVANKAPANVETIININTADTAMLVQLKGIGNKLANRIVKYRDALGGFYTKSQYKEIYGLDTLALSELNRLTRIEGPLRMIKINEATEQQLWQHPYLRKKGLARVIANYRMQHGPYGSIDDLSKIQILDSTTLHKVSPFLQFTP